MKGIGRLQGTANCLKEGEGHTTCVTKYVIPAAVIVARLSRTNHERILHPPLELEIPRKPFHNARMPTSIAVGESVGAKEGVMGSACSLEVE